MKYIKLFENYSYDETKKLSSHLTNIILEYGYTVNGYLDGSKITQEFNRNNLWIFAIIVNSNRLALKKTFRFHIDDLAEFLSYEYLPNLDGIKLEFVDANSVNFSIERDINSIISQINEEDFKMKFDVWLTAKKYNL